MAVSKQMQIKTLSNINFDEITSAFNKAFSDYSIPMSMTVDALKKRVVSYRVDLSLSAGAFVDGELVGFILNATETDGEVKLVYNSGTGVVPIHRGNQLSRQMHNFILPVLKDNFFQKYVLEVIDDNKAAIKTYLGVGYKTKRRLLCFRGSIISKNENSTTMIEKMEPLWEEVKPMWDWNPTWQNTIQSLMAVGTENDFIGIRVDSQMVAYSCYHPGQSRIHQLAVHPNHRRKGYASALLNYIAETTQKEVSMINVDELDLGMKAFFHSIGMENYLNQIEMQLEI